MDSGDYTYDAPVTNWRATARHLGYLCSQYAIASGQQRRRAQELEERQALACRLTGEIVAMLPEDAPPRLALALGMLRDVLAGEDPDGVLVLADIDEGEEAT